MDEMDVRVLQRLYFTVSISLTQPPFRVIDILDLIRYPANIPPGTAIPSWAYDNITVSKTPSSGDTLVLMSNV